MANEQSYSNHRRYNPWHHFVVLPILSINLIVEIQRLINDPSGYQGWRLVLAVGLFLFSFTARGMALRAQDRVIRLEEQLRLSRILGDRAAIEALRPGQLIALRFAPDDEVPELVQRIVGGELQTGDQIKKAIRVWKPDYLRV
jgi:hypothetical protein